MCGLEEVGVSRYAGDVANERSFLYESEEIKS